MDKSAPTAAIAAIFLTFVGVIPLQSAGAELGTAAEPAARPSLQRAWQTIEDLASSSNPQHRKYSAVAFALLAQKHGRALESAKSLLQSDHEAEVRAFTAAALGQERVRAAIPALREALDDPAAPVAFAAAKPFGTCEITAGRSSSRGSDGSTQKFGGSGEWLPFRRPP